MTDEFASDLAIDEAGIALAMSRAWKEDPAPLPSSKPLPRTRRADYRPVGGEPADHARANQTINLPPLSFRLLHASEAVPRAVTKPRLHLARPAGGCADPRCLRFEFLTNVTGSPGGAGVDRAARQRLSAGRQLVNPGDPALVEAAEPGAAPDLGQNILWLVELVQHQKAYSRRPRASHGPHRGRDKGANELC